MLAGLWDDRFATFNDFNRETMRRLWCFVGHFYKSKRAKKKERARQLTWLRWIILNKRTVRRRVESQLIPSQFCFLRSAFPICRHLSGSVTSRRVICASWLVGFQRGISVLRGTDGRRDGNGSPLVFEVLRFTPSLILFGEEKSPVIQSWTPVASLRWNFFATYFPQCFVYSYWDKKNVYTALSKLANKTGTWDLFTWNGKENTPVCF